MVSAQKDTAHAYPPPFAHLDGAAFAGEIAAMRKVILQRLGPADLRHLRRMTWWGRLCTLLGYAMAPWGINPLAVLGISMGNCTRWMVMHHVSHRGYDKVPEVPHYFTSQGFAVGWRRFVDWFDVIYPEAWRMEHNIMHHSYTGELHDPDLVEQNISDSFMTRCPTWVRYFMTFMLGISWKWSYYAPNTMRIMDNIERKKRGEAPIQSWWVYFNPFWSGGRLFWRRCLLPYGLMRFVVLPALFLPMGGHAALWVLLNSVLAEMLANLHSFAVIGPNHTGEDLYRFDGASKDKVEFYVRQVVGSVNYNCGSDSVDFAQMWLNYQIEHHIWPDLPMLQYRLVQPEVRQLCAAYGLPYVQESVWRRVWKLTQIMVGATRMRRVDHAARAPQRAPELAEA